MSDNKRLLFAIGIAVAAFSFGLAMYYLVLSEDRIESVTFIEGVATDGYPAPSGFEVLYRDSDDLCVLNLLDTSRHCQTIRDLPNISHDPVYESAVWSPDGEHVALVNSDGSSFTDPDLIVVDLKTERVRNLTDDGYEGQVITGSPGPSFDVDIQPAWSPDSEQIAFARTTIDSQGQAANSSLMAVDVVSDTVRRIGSLPGHDATENGLKNTHALAWSPNGRQLAVSTFHLPSGNLERDGLWLVDVATGEAEQVMSLATIDQAVRDRYEDRLELDDHPFTIVGIEWSPDGESMLVRTGQRPVDIDRMPLFILNVDECMLEPLRLFDDESIPAAAQVSDTMATFSSDGSLLFVAYGIANDTSRHIDSLDDDSTTEPTHALWISDLRNNSHEFLGHLSLQWRSRVTWGPRDYILLPNYMLTVEGNQIGLFN